jgi:hypothetical protein
VFSPAIFENNQEEAQKEFFAGPAAANNKLRVFYLACDRGLIACTPVPKR